MPLNKLSTLTPNEVYLLQSHAYLLECTLATYGGLCGKSKQPKGELDRHESIILEQFQTHAKDFAEARNHSSFAVAKWRTLPRVDEILKSMVTQGWSAEFAVHAYFNKVRYGVGKSA